MIPFNKASITKIEKKYVLDCLSSARICGDNKYTKLVDEKIKDMFNLRLLLTTSCSHALDMTAILENFQKGDEIIVPSFTFVSTADAFVLRGAAPVFAEIDSKTMNIDANKIEKLITNKTKAIYVVHYAGVACDMDKIMEIAQKYNLKVIEDSAQAIGSYYKGKLLGTIGDYGTYSFHETKNIVMGEGGALIVKNDDKFSEAEMLREKGTNRKQFFKGFVDKYTWQIPGSSYLPSDILAALLFGQLERFNEIQEKRLKIWNSYNICLEKYEKLNLLRRPFIPNYATNNAHMYYLILPNEEKRQKFINFMKENGIETPFHYIPLHLSKVGSNFGYKKGDLPITEEYSSRLVRLPLYADMTKKDLNFIISKLNEFFNKD
jgi:dTDP-4-amino-4,6-dideoxygalactose transaminase